jgi:hypothetical protein
MKKLILTLPMIVVLAACGGGTSSTTTTTPPGTPTAPAPAIGQWVIVTQSNVTPGQETIANFDLASIQPDLDGYQFGSESTSTGVEGTPIPSAVTPDGDFGWIYPQCAPYGTGNAGQNCPTVEISGFDGVGTSNGVSLSITGSSSNVALEAATFSGTISTDGTTMTGTYTATVNTATGQSTQTDNGNFFATVLTSSSLTGSYAGTVAVESCGTGGVNCLPPEDANLSLTYSGTFDAPAGSLQFTLQGQTYTASLATPTTKATVGGLFNIGLTDPSGNGAGIFDYVPGVNFSVPPILNPSANTLFANFLIPNGNGALAIRGFLMPGSAAPGESPSVGATSLFTYNAGVIAQAPLVTFSPATPTASTSFCAGGCSQIGLVSSPVSFSATISQPVTQGSLRVFVLDTSAPATGACPPSTQIATCSYMNYPGNGIYIGDFTPGGGFTLQSVIPGGNTIEPTDNLEVVIVDPAGSWTGTVSWQLNYQ